MTHEAGTPAEGWVPSSPCGPHCQPAPVAASLRRITRSVGLLAVLVAAVATAPALAVGRARVRAGWLGPVSQLVLLAMGIRVRVHARAGSPTAARWSWPTTCPGSRSWR